MQTMKSFDAQRWRALSTLLDQALDMDIATRTAWLDRLDAGDATDVRRLLANLADSGSTPAPAPAGGGWASFGDASASAPAAAAA